jgi:opacity protein-like surface antigen
MTTTFLQWGVRSLLGAVAAMVVFASAPAEAQIMRVGSTADSRQAIGFTLGYFVVKGDDGRDENDVLFANKNSLLFETKDFNGASFGAEWLVAVTDYIEVGAGISFYQRTVPSIYAQLQADDGSEIEQDLKLRQVPMSATVRFLPIGRNGGFQPYIGAGIGVINWRYTETGEFVDFDDQIFRATFTAKGNETGPVILGGVRFPVSDVWTVGGEVRWHRAEGDTGGIDEGFLGDKIDLGGLTYNFAVHFRF